MDQSGRGPGIERNNVTNSIAVSSPSMTEKAPAMIMLLRVRLTKPVPLNILIIAAVTSRIRR